MRSLKLLPPSVRVYILATARFSNSLIPKIFPRLKEVRIFPKHFKDANKPNSPHIIG